MALECPIVSSDLPPLREAIDNTTALLVRVEDPGALASALCTTLKDRDSAQKRASAARQRFESEFTVESSARRITALYHKVTAG